MKKILSFLAIIMLMAMCPKNMWAETWTNVSTPAEFEAAVKWINTSGTHAANIRLTSNISLADFTPTDRNLFNFEFSGKITGENANGEDFALTGAKYPVFKKVTDSEITHVMFMDCVISNTSDRSAIGFIAPRSANSTFTFVRFRNCKIYDPSYSIQIFNCTTAIVGSLVGWSCSDNISYCTVESDCYIFGNQADSETVPGEDYPYTFNGGFVGYADKTAFTFCYNSGEVEGHGKYYLDGTDESYTGGIVGEAKGGTIDRCLNTGKVTGTGGHGGIVGKVNNATITKCVNTGSVSYSNDASEYMGGIVGYMTGSESSISYCLNFGNIKHHEHDFKYGALEGYKENGAVHGNGNYYHCYVDGDLWTHSSENSASGDVWATVLSGKYAYEKTDGDGNKYLYQSIDNAVSSVTLPVPIPDFGTVHLNVLCDESSTESYSNLFQGTAGHTQTASAYGACATCGNVLSTLPASITISTPSELYAFSKFVSQGTDYSGVTVNLACDMDMSNIAKFTPIGISKTYPFKGTFDGHGHRIKNLIMTESETYTGLFGCVAGASTVIKNVVIDKTSIFASATKSGVAGLIGCVQSNSGDVCNVTIQNCGNEAQVSTGTYNAAGILGGVYTNDKTQIYIQNCYNTGFIAGSKECAAICGYARNNYTITNCYNGGALVGGEDGKYFYRNATEGTHYVANCYDINGKQGDGVARLQSMHGPLGILCNDLNTNRGDLSAWTHNIATDDYPTFGDAGIYYTRTMANQWGTICLPFAAQSGDDYDFYELSDVNSDALVLTKVDALAAGRPAIVRRNASATGIKVNASSTPFVDAPVTVSTTHGLTLTGAFSDTDITDKDGYIIANNSFWKIADIKGENKVNCAPFRAWLAGSISSGAKQLTIGFDDDTPTAVETINAITTGTAEYYDLNGRKLSDLQQGVNVVKFKNGTIKKVTIK